MGYVCSSLCPDGQVQRVLSVDSVFSQLDFTLVQVGMFPGFFHFLLVILKQERAVFFPFKGDADIQAVIRKRQAGTIQVLRYG